MFLPKIAEVVTLEIWLFKIKLKNIVLRIKQIFKHFKNIIQLEI
jgi:hypothetical protein